MKDAALILLVLGAGLLASAAVSVARLSRFSAAAIVCAAGVGLSLVSLGLLLLALYLIAV